MMRFFLKYIVNKNDVISFDIFDTLIERTVVSPLDIFLIVGQTVLGETIAEKFLEDRKQAESTARKNVKNGEVTLDEIYDYLPASYGKMKEILKQAEIQTELDCCKKKESMAEIYQYAITSGKDIYLISDMYLSLGMIEKMLSKCGIEGYRKCYISCEERCNKITGDLFKLVMNENGIRSSKMLHIGDSFTADFRGARKTGIQAILITRKNRLKRIWYEKVKTKARW